MKVATAVHLAEYSKIISKNSNLFLQKTLLLTYIPLSLQSAFEKGWKVLRKSYLICSKRIKEILKIFDQKFGGINKGTYLCTPNQKGIVLTNVNTLKMR
jgi:hypothetical protein